MFGSSGSSDGGNVDTGDQGLSASMAASSLRSSDAPPLPVPDTSRSEGLYRELPSNVMGDANFQQFSPMTTPYDSDATVYRSLRPQAGGVMSLGGGQMEGAGVYRSLAMAPPPSFKSLQAASRAEPELGFIGAKKFDKPNLFKGGSSSVSSTAAPLRPTPGQVTPLPYPFMLEPHSHCIIKGKIDDLVKSVDEVLQMHRVDVTSWKPEKCKWKGKMYVRNWCLELRVHIFEGDWGENQWVLEFQRRQGCAMQFAQLFREARAELVSKQVVCDESGTLELDTEGPNRQRREVTGFTPPPVKGMAKPTLNEQALRPLVDMSRSEFCDVQCQAVREIANLAEDESARRALVEYPKLIEHLVDCCESPHPGLHRCAAAALCNVTLCDESHKYVLLAEGVQRLLKFFERENIELEAKRQSAAALRNMCRNAGCSHNARSEFSKVKDTLAGVLESGDERLKTFALQATTALESC